MNKIFLSSILSCIALSASAQSSYDAANFTQTELNGTARYVGMGGALNALGGEISTMGSNPAGTGLFRRSDVAITASSLITGQEGQLGQDKSRMSLDQAGVVFSFPIDDSGNGLQYVNFGVNYKKSRNFFDNQYVDVQNLYNSNDPERGFSQTYQIADLANINEAIYMQDKNHRWGLLADLCAESETHEGVLYKFGHEYFGIPASSALYSRCMTGGVYEADVNLSFNSSDRFYYGLTVGLYDVDLNRTAFYQELGEDNNFYDITSWYKTSGSGVDLKFGFICRPIETSPFRFGVAVQTPTWFNLTDANGAEVYFNDAFVYDGDCDYDYDYRLNTPWKFNLSLGHTIGKQFAFGAEYELTDYSSACYRTSPSNYADQQYLGDINRECIKPFLKTQHTVKLGGEYRPNDFLSLRLGYNFLSSAYKAQGYRTILYHEPFTETDFTNWGAINRFTAGLGFRWNGGYLDLAYQGQFQKGDFYAFDDEDLRATKISNNRHQIMATLGFRF